MEEAHKVSGDKLDCDVEHDKYDSLAVAEKCESDRPVSNIVPIDEVVRKFIISQKIGLITGERTSDDKRRSEDKGKHSHKSDKHRKKKRKSEHKDGHSKEHRRHRHKERSSSARQIDKDNDAKIVVGDTGQVDSAINSANCSSLNALGLLTAGSTGPAVGPDHKDEAAVDASISKSIVSGSKLQIANNASLYDAQNKLLGEDQLATEGIHVSEQSTEISLNSSKNTHEKELNGVKCAEDCTNVDREHKSHSHSRKHSKDSSRKKKKSKDRHKSHSQEKSRHRKRTDSHETKGSRKHNADKSDQKVHVKQDTNAEPLSRPDMESKENMSIKDHRKFEDMKQSSAGSETDQSRSGQNLSKSSSEQIACEREKRKSGNDKISGDVKGTIAVNKSLACNTEKEKLNENMLEMCKGKNALNTSHQEAEVRSFDKRHSVKECRDELASKNDGNESSHDHSHIVADKKQEKLCSHECAKEDSKRHEREHSRSRSRSVCDHRQRDIDKSQKEKQSEENKDYQKFDHAEKAKSGNEKVGEKDSSKRHHRSYARDHHRKEQNHREKDRYRSRSNSPHNHDLESDSKRRKFREFESNDRRRQLVENGTKSDSQRYQRKNSASDNSLSPRPQKRKTDGRFLKEPSVIQLSDDDADVITDEMMEKLHKRLTTSIKKGKELQAEKEMGLISASWPTVINVDDGDEDETAHKSLFEGGEILETANTDLVSVAVSTDSAALIAAAFSMALPDKEGDISKLPINASSGKHSLLGKKPLLKFGLKISETSAALISLGVKSEAEDGQKGCDTSAQKPSVQISVSSPEHISPTKDEDSCQKTSGTACRQGVVGEMLNDKLTTSENTVDDSKADMELEVDNDDVQNGDKSGASLQSQSSDSTTIKTKSGKTEETKLDLDKKHKESSHSHGSRKRRHSRSLSKSPEHQPKSLKSHRDKAQDRSKDRRDERRHSAKERSPKRHRSSTPKHSAHPRSHRSRSQSRSRHSRSRRSRSRTPQSRSRASALHRSRSRDSPSRHPRSRRSRSRRSSSRHSKGRASRSPHASVPRRSRSRQPEKHHSRSPSVDGKKKSPISTRLNIDKEKLREIAIKNAYANLQFGVIPMPELKPAEVVAIKSGGKSVEELTEFCKKIAGEQQSKSDNINVNVMKSTEDEETIFSSTTLKAISNANIILNIRNAKQLPVLTPQEKAAKTAVLRTQFPVSSGTDHRTKESDWVPVTKDEKPAAPVEEEKVYVEPPSNPDDLETIVSERVSALRKLKNNPHDKDALGTIFKVQQQMKQWAEVKQPPGQFLGSTGVQTLTPHELANENPRFQAWVKKDTFTKAAPMTGGIGRLLLQRMGWKVGTGLGKNNEGITVPIALEIKTDRKGLTSLGETVHKPYSTNPNIPQSLRMDLSDKHPVCALTELCSKRRWDPPHFDLMEEIGPAHCKTFRFKVTVNGVEYLPGIGSNNKKTAKLQSAQLCLQELGLLPRT